jgi:hypothetical protein
MSGLTFIVDVRWSWLDVDGQRLGVHPIAIDAFELSFVMRLDHYWGHSPAWPTRGTAWAREASVKECAAHAGLSQDVMKDLSRPVWDVQRCGRPARARTSTANICPRSRRGEPAISHRGKSDPRLRSLASISPGCVGVAFDVPRSVHFRQLAHVERDLAEIERRRALPSTANGRLHEDVAIVHECAATVHDRLAIRLEELGR